MAQPGRSDYPAASGPVRYHGDCAWEWAEYARSTSAPAGIRIRNYELGTWY